MAELAPDEGGSGVIAPQRGTSNSVDDNVALRAPEVVHGEAGSTRSDADTRGCPTELAPDEGGSGVIAPQRGTSNSVDDNVALRAPEVVHGEAGLQTAQSPTRVEQSGSLMKDKIFLTIFVGQLVVVSLMGIVAGSGSRRNIWLSNASAREETTGVWIVTSITGALMGLCALGLAYTAPAHTHVVANCQRVAGCAMAFLAVLLIVYGKLLLGLVISVLVVADLVWFLRASNELEFVVVLLQVANAALREHRGVLVLVGVAMAVQAAYSILWLMIVVNVLRAGAGRSGDAAFLGVMLFSYRWTTTVIKGVIRVAVSGAVTDALRMPVVNSGDSPRHGTPMSSMPLKSALDRLESEEEEDEVIAATSTADLAAAGGPGPQLVSKYTRAACFTSIGSICAGSLVGAVTPVLWALLRSLRVLERSRLRGCVVPLADMVEGVLIMSHKYAYPNVAVYGKPWFQAARESWKAFNDRGLEAVVANDASDRVLLFICYAVGTVQAICAWPVLGPGVHAWTFVLFVAFWFGFAAASLALTPVETVVTSLFVSFANFPESLSQRHPIIYHRLCRISEVRHYQRSHSDGV